MGTEIPFGFGFGLGFDSDFGFDLDVISERYVSLIGLDVSCCREQAKTLTASLEESIWNEAGVCFER